jgi:hypothetical protein
VNRRQKALLIESVLVLGATAAAVIGMMHLKDHVNRSEAIRAMEGLGTLVLEYRKEHRSLPPQSYVDSVKSDVEGAVRMGNVRYRALYIGMGAPNDTILAYSEKRHPSSLLKDGFVVLRLDGTVEWMPAAEFTRLFTQQRAPAEPELPER